MGGRLISSLMNGHPRNACAGDSDSALLDRFVARRDEAAFAVLVRRHGPMVWAVCYNALPVEADAEDAFQATFLDLVRRASSVRNRAVVGAWLHSAAVRVCLEARRAHARRVAREAKAAVRATAASENEAWSDLVTAVHREIQLLSPREHQVFVLCGLQGVPQAQAARQLGLKPHSVSCLLARARKRLRTKLTRRGALAVLALVMATTSGPAAVPGSLLTHTRRLASSTAVLSPSVLHLASSIREVTMRKSLLFGGVAVLLAIGVTLGSFVSGGVRAEPIQGQGSQQSTTSTGRGEQGLVQGGPPVLSQIPYVNRLFQNTGASDDRRENSGTYKIVIQSPHTAEPVLNELYAQGWELCSTSAIGSTPQVMFVFRRARPSVMSRNTQTTPNRDAHGNIKVETKQLPQLPAGEGEAGFDLVRLQRTSASGAGQMLKGLLKSCEVEVDARTNSLLIRGPAEEVSRLKQLLEHMDSQGGQDSARPK